MLSRAALLAIDGYQRHLSPRKGYGCAYRIAHGGTGCSGFAKGAIAELGFGRALPLIRARFLACRDAAKELHDAKVKQKKDRWYDKADCCSGCDIPRCGKADATPDCDCAPDCCSL
jgi:putative component of membrane protein insertase Oxa1/YidC/SpoIIIJ protein YidD